MKSDENVTLNEEDQTAWSGSGLWIGPGTYTALVAVTNDIVTALCALSKKIKAELAETQNLMGAEQNTVFQYHISDDYELASIRMSLFLLLSAISCEESINQFCYFELPKEASETIEKLQPKEKLLIAAAFLGYNDMKSSHVYEGVKSLFDWRNHYAHGHNPGQPTALQKNHVDISEKLMSTGVATLEDELKSLRKAAGHYREILAWLCKTGKCPMVKVDFFQREASRFVEIFKCFSVTKKTFPPDSQGLRFQFFDLDVEVEKLAKWRVAHPKS